MRIRLQRMRGRRVLMVPRAPGLRGRSLQPLRRGPPPARGRLRRVSRIRVLRGWLLPAPHLFRRGRVPPFRSFRGRRALWAPRLRERSFQPPRHGPPPAWGRLRRVSRIRVLRGSAVPLFPGAEVSVAAGASTGDCAISGAAQRRAATSSRIRSRFMVDAYGFRTEPPKRGVPYCKDSPRSTLPMQAKSCSDGCKRLWMSGVLLKKSCDRGRRTCRLRTRPASGRSACLLRRSGIRPPPDGERRGIAARMLRVAARPVRASPSALRSAPLRSEPVRTCSAPSRPASPGAMRRSAAAPRARRCPIRRCAA